MKLIPLSDKVVVQPLEPEEQTTGGIVLPDSARERPQQGKILSVGDGRMLENGRRTRMQVGEGDRVIFRSYAGNEVTVDGDELLILSEDDILAVIA